MRSNFAASPNVIGDQDVIARFRAGDDAAFKIIFDTHWDALCAFAFRYVHAREAAEDVVQGVFARLAEQRATWDPSRNLRAYLYAATRNAALDALRHAGVEAKWAENVLVFSGSTPHTPRAADVDLTSDEVAAAIRDAMQSLTPRVRLVAMHRLYDGLSRAEIAALLGTSEETVHKQLGVALRVLRDRLRHLR